MTRKISFMFALALALTISGAALADKAFPVKHGKAFTVKDVKGSYAFSFQGEVIGLGPVAAAGVIRADGRGNITEAVRTISVNGAPVVETFTCTITVNRDGTGAAECPLDDPLPGFPIEETFDFALEDNAKGFRLVGTTPGIVVVGSGRRQ